MLRRLAGPVLASVMLGAGVPGARAGDAGSPGPAKTTTAEGFKSLVAALSGSWALAVRSEPQQDGTPATESTGTARWYTSAGGQVLLEDEHMTIQSAELRLLGLIWWDGKREALAGMLCSNRSPRTCDPKASLDDIRLSWERGRLLIEEKEHQRDGSVLLFRESYSEITPRSYLQTGEIGPPDGPFRRIFTVHGTRSKN